VSSLRRVLITAGVVAVAAAAGVAATGVLGGGSGDATAAAPRGPAGTATVERTTLTRNEIVPGTLGFGDAVAVRAPGPAGILTQLPGEGAVLERGDAVYSLDERKVPLFYGATPLYRALTDGAEGGDVAVLEENLAALGYGGFTVDTEYTARTAEAVAAWQEDQGREPTGTVSVGDAVVAPGPRRVAEVAATIGTALGGDILTWSGTERIVSVDLDVRYEDLVRAGVAATVRLPDGTEVAAQVSSVGNAAVAAAPGEENTAEEATLPVLLSVQDQAKLGRYQAAPVDVTLTAETRENVLAVPVNALVARKGGGYAVQVVTGGDVEHVPVTLGMFADGLVEISGEGVTEGMKVGVPR
jgi:peptidoglycan hydrolase-like protein with peptidoglycan-binding domain